MAVRAKTTDELSRMFEPRVLKAFLAALESVTDDIQINVIEEQLKRGNVDAAIAALNLRPSQFGPLDRAIKEVFNTGGIESMKRLPKIKTSAGGKITAHFDSNNPEAERLISEQSSTLIKNITDDARTSAREVILTGQQVGQNPRSTALDLVGRVNQTTGRREGGVIGHRPAVANRISRIRRGLVTGDREMMQRYLRYELRDKRLDGFVERALRDGRGLKLADANKIARRYSNKALRHRGEVIARTETLESLHMAQNEGIRQQIAEGNVRSDQITKVWSSTMDLRTRDSHRSMNGKTSPFGEPFTSPSGAQMMYPQDRSLGAGGEEIINCRCTMELRIDYLGEYQ